MKLWDWFQQRFGIETKFTKHEREQNEQIQSLKNDITDIKNHRNEFIETQNKIISSIDSLTKSFIDKEVDDMRWDMLNFANALMAGNEFNKEQFDHALAVYSKYSKIIKDNDLTNEQVDISMAFVKERYQECLKNRFLNDERDENRKEVI